MEVNRSFGSIKTFPNTSLTKRILLNWQTYLLLLPGLIWYGIFCYMPMGGLSLAFKDYKANLGVWGSPWIGFLNYDFVFRDPDFFRALRNTIVISFCYFSSRYLLSWHCLLTKYGVVATKKCCKQFTPFLIFFRGLLWPA